MSFIHVATRRRSLRCLCLSIAVGLLANASMASAQGSAPATTKDGLPANFRPPRAVADVINTEEELTTEDSYTQWKRKELAKFVEALKQPKPTPAHIKLIEDACRMRVDRLSLKQHRNNLKPVRVEIYRDVHLQATTATREIALKVMTSEAERLLAGNLSVRLQALILLAELETVPANPAKNAPAVLYPEAINVCLKVLNDKSQPEAVRLLAASQTEKLVRESGLSTNPPAKLRVEAGRALVPLVLQSGGSDWYQKALIGAVQAVNLPTLPDAANTQQPLIATSLHKVLSDSKRSLPVRVRAANALGLVTLPASGVDVGTMTKDCLKLGREVVADYNSAALNRTKDAFLLQDIYLGLKAWRNAAPNDKNVGAAYTAILKPTSAALLALNTPQPGPLPNTVLDDINGLVGADKSPTSADKQGVLATPNKN